MSFRPHYQAGMFKIRRKWPIALQTTYLEIYTVYNTGRISISDSVSDEATQISALRIE